MKTKKQPKPRKSIRQKNLPLCLASKDLLDQIHNRRARTFPPDVLSSIYPGKRTSAWKKFSYYKNEKHLCVSVK